MMRFLSRLFKRNRDRGAPKHWSLTPLAARMRAGMMVRSARKLGVELDYSPESLAKVDLLIDKERKTRIRLTGEMAYEMVSLGAYAGEVMVRNLEGRWAKGAAQPQQDPLVLIIGGKYAINVVSIALRRFIAGEPHSLARMFEEARKLKDAIP